MQLKHTENAVGPLAEQAQRRLELEAQYTTITTERDALALWLLANVSDPMWMQRQREYNLLSGRLHVVRTRLVNNYLGNPELGMGLPVSLPRPTPK